MFEKIEALIQNDDVYGENSEDHYEPLFNAALHEAVERHYSQCREYRNYLEYNHFHSDQITENFDLEQLPWLLINIFKEWELLSVEREKILHHFTSSGTTGQKSQIFFDEGSFSRGLRMVTQTFKAHSLYNPSLAVNYLLFADQPTEQNRKGTAYTDMNITRMTAQHEIFYALRGSATGSTFAEDETLATLKRFAEQAPLYPLRIVGFPAFLYRTVKHLETSRTQLSLGSQSFILTGGGWKTENQALSKQELISYFSHWLGIPESNIRDSYGMVEHGVPYVECEQHHLHIPIYARALVRNFWDLTPSPMGEPGLLQLITPYMTSQPNVSLLTLDKAIMSQRCQCGRRAPYIEILGRAAIRKNKGCALSTLDLLPGEKAA